MVLNRKVTGAATTIPSGIALGLLVSLAVTLLGAALTAYLVSAEKIGENGIGYSAMIILALGSAAGAWLSMSKIKRLRMQICLLTGICYYLLLLAMTALFFGGQYEGMGVTALAVLGGCGAVAILGARGEKRGKARYRKNTYR